jgi:hypothetical protein
MIGKRIILVLVGLAILMVVSGLIFGSLISPSVGTKNIDLKMNAEYEGVKNESPVTDFVPNDPGMLVDEKQESQNTPVETDSTDVEREVDSDIEDSALVEPESLNGVL